MSRRSGFKVARVAYCAATGLVSAGVVDRRVPVTSVSVVFDVVGVLGCNLVWCNFNSDDLSPLIESEERNGRRDGDRTEMSKMWQI
jgi:hypothetical protein